MSSPEIPAAIQQDLIKLQQLQQQYELVIAQRTQMEIQLKETEFALAELGKLEGEPVVYKSVGPLLMRGNKAQFESELNDSKETLELRIKTLLKQEEQLRKQVQELSLKIQSQLKTGGSPPSN
ncbi:MAG: prefoldin subunit beta [Candidatus Odinarchaeota archaeon]